MWLVAHLDSKSQPVPSLVRVAGVMLLASAWLLAIMAAVLQLASLPNRMLWWWRWWTRSSGRGTVVASVVGARSPGAVDNASGVAAVLAAAEMLDPKAAGGGTAAECRGIGTGWRAGVGAGPPVGRWRSTVMAWMTKES